MQLGYFGINMSGVNKGHFAYLLHYCGYRYRSLEELRVQLGAILFSTMAKAMTDGPSRSDYLNWTSEHMAALEVLPAEQRVQFVIDECLAHEQTQLSSVEHLV